MTLPRQRLKRAFDLTVGLVALLFLLVPMIVIAILVRRDLGSPVLFRQQRPGFGCQPFWLIKFRTMRNATDAQGNLLPDGERLTMFGRWLRKTSLDELPEVINVIRGEMSFVGPRPLLMSYVPYFTEREQLRHSVRPGITGWAQVNGRNHLCWDKRLALDAWYVENVSMSLDLRILLKTLLVVITNDGVAVNTDEKETRLSDERQGQAGDLSSPVAP